jgi:MoaA/NifB/PqqE/SkfB family radical SAM enzyme
MASGTAQADQQNDLRARRPVGGKRGVAQGGNPVTMPGLAPGGTGTLPGFGYLLHEGRARCLARRIERNHDLLDQPVSRVVIFLTSQCALACRYCRSKSHAAPPWSRDRLLRLLETSAATGTRHVHWTGGEATQHPQLAGFVRAATELGLRNSVSTNGTARVRSYLQLVDAGMSRFYVSLDLLQDQRLAALTGAHGLARRVTGVIRTLVRERDRRPALHIAVNSVLTRRTLEALMAADARELDRLLGWAVDCGIDDFKFLPASTETNWSELRNSETFCRFRKICRRRVPKRFGMFHFRLANLSSGNGIGFPDSRRRLCFQCLDDRAYDSIGAYGCVIQLREGGRRIYEHSMSADEKALRLRRFLHQNRCRDSLCRRYCFDIYRLLNERVGFLLDERRGA